jgi:hypothetical protein
MTMIIMRNFLGTFVYIFDIFYGYYVFFTTYFYFWGNMWVYSIASFLQAD